ncbi:MAG: hybrid sensor histidine kinase/response regulator, partial [Anaerolineae bacterium]|nr:hybrid sensor histidine kinase/response regulator [Anaerolineae bacterium]
NLIVGFAEMMYLVPETYEGVVWAPTLVADIGRMYRASRHLQDLVNDILDLSRIDAARLPMFRELSDVRAIVQDAVATVNPLFEQKGLTLTIECAADLPKLFVDRTRIRQAILNLLNNAVRFTDQGGITIRVERSDEAVLLHVSDTGVGIPQDQLERIFEQFTQVEIGSRSRGGAGLGLAISRQFVELHGGRMWAESETGKGSTFSVSLPLPGVVAPQLLRRLPGRTTVDFSRAPVVVVDPDPGIADMLSRYLGDRPVLAARDLAESERVVHAEHPLAVIVNCVPETPPASWVGPSGPLSERYNVPVLRCSIPSPSWLSQSTGLDECLTKPIAREMLGEVLERYCGAAGKVAIVDDEAGFVSLITRMIETLPGDYEVVTAYSGAEAIRLVEEQRPALMLLDLLMPEMSGFDVLDVLRANRDLEHLRVVAVTATSYAEDILTRQGGYLTVTQPNGYSAGAVADFLNLALQIFRPDYVGDARNAYSA